MEKNVDVKEIAITVGIYLVLSFIFPKIGNSIFDFHDARNYIRSINNGYISEFIEGLVKLIIPFIGFYAISLFSLKDKNNIKIFCGDNFAGVVIFYIFKYFSRIWNELCYYEIYEQIRNGWSSVYRYFYDFSFT